MVDIIRPNFGTVWAASGEKLSPTEIKIQGGWIKEMMPYQYQNFLQNRVDNAITYLLQKGVPEWDASQEYTSNKSVVTYSGQMYMALTTNTNVLPTVTASWKRLTTTLGANGAIPVAFGGTGATNASDARTNLGLGTAATLDASTLVLKSGTGNAPAADKLTTARTITLTGGASGSVSFDGSSDQNLNVTGLNASSLNSGTIPVAVLGKTVLKTSATGSAQLPSGTTAERDSTPSEGWTRWNRTGKALETWNGASWVSSFAVDLGTLVGTGPSQVPSNSMLGSAAYLNRDGFVERTQNYTTLRAYVGTSSIIQVVAEGISGLFRVVTSGTDNGGTLIVATDGRKWQRVYHGGLDVKWFGAVGNGVTDDTVPIQTAIDTCYSLNAGEVYFPIGTYAVTSLKRNWDNVVSVCIRGAGKKSTVFIKYGTGTTPIFDWSADADILETYSDFRDFSISGNSKTHHGISLLRCARFSMKNVDIRSCDRGINNIGALVWTGNELTLQGNNFGLYTDMSPAIGGVSIYPNAITLNSCQINGNTTFGVFGNYANGLRLRDSDLEHNGTPGNESTGAFIVGGTSAEFGAGSVSIDGCWFEGNKGWTLVFAGGQTSSFSVKDTLIVNSESGYAMLVQSASHLSISGVDAVSPSDTLWIQAASQTSISDSTISIITDGSTRSTWKNVITSKDPIEAGGFNRGVEVSNGSSLKLSWAGGTGVHEIKPDPGTGALLITTQAQTAVLNGALGLVPRTATGVLGNGLFVDSADGKLKFRNGSGVIKVLTP